MLITAREAGAATAIVTSSETPYDAVADWRITERVEVVLPALRDAVAA
jgi:hypothetical protein